VRATTVTTLNGDEIERPVQHSPITAISNAQHAVGPFSSPSRTQPTDSGSVGNTVRPQRGDRRHRRHGDRRYPVGSGCGVDVASMWRVGRGLAIGHRSVGACQTPLLFGATSREVFDGDSGVSLRPTAVTCSRDQALVAEVCEDPHEHGFGVDVLVEARPS
jgi:hypothetical protein